MYNMLIIWNSYYRRNALGQGGVAWSATIREESSMVSGDLRIVCRSWDLQEKFNHRKFSSGGLSNA